MKLFLLILVCLLFAISIVWYGIKLKKYISIYNDFAGGIKAKKAYKTNDNVLLKSHFKKAIIYLSIYTSIVLSILLVYIIGDVINVVDNGYLLIDLFPLVAFFTCYYFRKKLLVIAKSYTHIIFGEYIFKISDIQSVDYESGPLYNRFIFTMNTGKIKRMNIVYDKIAYAFIQKTIEENKVIS